MRDVTFSETDGVDSPVVGSTRVALYCAQFSVFSKHFLIPGSPCKRSLFFFGISELFSCESFDWARQGGLSSIPL